MGCTFVSHHDDQNEKSDNDDVGDVGDEEKEKEEEDDDDGDDDDDDDESFKKNRLSRYVSCNQSIVRVSEVLYIDLPCD